MIEALSFLPAFSKPLFMGILGATLTLTGSVLRSGLNPAPRKIGICCCVFGLVLMTVGFLCITSDTSLLAYAHRG